MFGTLALRVAEIDGTVVTLKFLMIDPQLAK